MKVLITGSSGRVGRAVWVRLAQDHDVVGFDSAVSSTARIIADITDRQALMRAGEGADAIVHVAALHAPHVGHWPDTAFERINVHGTACVIEAALASGIRRIVFTSTTALYGRAVPEIGPSAWIDERTVPQPRTIYHRTKLQAEELLRTAAGEQLDVRVLRMSRCFPEPAPTMAAYRLHRGVDARDVAQAHALALTNPGPAFQTYVISGRTPFREEDLALLCDDAPAVLRKRAPDLVAAFERRGWPLPPAIDRVYSAARAEAALGWVPRYGFQEVLDELDRCSPEVLPVRAPAVGSMD